MSKISTKIICDRGDIEISKKDDEYYVWVHNNLLSEHCGVTLTREEMLEFRALLLGGII